MAVSETLELQEGLQRQLGRDLDAVIVNAVLPQRFSAAELQRLSALDGDAITHSATLAARAVHDRARAQHNQLARLRRRSFEVIPIPFNQALTATPTTPLCGPTPCPSGAPE